MARIPVPGNPDFLKDQKQLYDLIIKLVVENNRLQERVTVLEAP